MNDANAGSYDASFFHHSPDKLVIQGGGYRNSGSTFTEISKFAAGADELGISNTVITVGSSSRAFEDVPINVVAPAPSVLDSTKLVKATSIAIVPVFRYAVLWSGAAVATAVVSRFNVNITGVVTITVKATDLANQMTSQSFEVSVP